MGALAGDHLAVGQDRDGHVPGAKGQALAVGHGQRPVGRGIDADDEGVGIGGLLHKVAQEVLRGILEIVAAADPQLIGRLRPLGEGLLRPVAAGNGIGHLQDRIGLVALAQQVHVALHIFLGKQVVIQALEPALGDLLRRQGVLPEKLSAVPRVHQTDRDGGHPRLPLQLQRHMIDLTGPIEDQMGGGDDHRLRRGRGRGLRRGGRRRRGRRCGCRGRGMRRRGRRCGCRGRGRIRRRSRCGCGRGRRGRRRCRRRRGRRCRPRFSSFGT